MNEENDRCQQLRDLSRIELVSIYINTYYDLGADDRHAYEVEFARRGLPLPAMPKERPVYPEAPVPPPRKSWIDRNTFVSYLFLLSLVPGIFYSWFYLGTRLVKRDFRTNTKHKVILSAISGAYIAAEALLVDYLVDL